LGRPAEARQQYEKLVAMGVRQSKSPSSSRLGSFSLAMATAKLGEACLNMNDIPAAASYCQQAVTRAEKAALENPDSLSDASTLSECLNRLGRVEMQRGNLRAAVETLERAAANSRRLEETWPENLVFKAELATTYSLLGDANMRLGLLTEAEKAFQQ